MTGNIICLRCKRRPRPYTQSGTGISSPMLSTEEAQVLCLIASGQTRGDIAHELSVSERAIRQHIKSLLYKARTRSKRPRTALSHESIQSQRRGQSQGRL
ncbi:LuxR C-terminal-related transcriptional regulator [Microvirga calopogonii]|uniref:LuxR C-terminal-related transcriptional regulator n=1 Tax=Microvirga calopogonii TaxID=2078013 RepID=UPI000E0CBFAA